MFFKNQKSDWHQTSYQQQDSRWQWIWFLQSSKGTYNSRFELEFYILLKYPSGWRILWQHRKCGCPHSKPCRSLIMGSTVDVGLKSMDTFVSQWVNVTEILRLFLGDRRLLSVSAKSFLWLDSGLGHFYPTSSPSLHHSGPTCIVISELTQLLL